MVAFSSLSLIPTPVRGRLLAPKRMSIAYERNTAPCCAAAGLPYNFAA